MSVFNSRYSIKQAAELTGLTKPQIRKWEERYQIVTPERLDNGYRIYSEEDIERLIKVKETIDQGFSIKQALQRIKKLDQKKQHKTSSNHLFHQQQIENNYYTFQLLKQGEVCNEKEMIMILQRAFHENGLKFLIDSVVQPFLKEIGERWRKGTWTEFQEHIASNVIKDYLIQLRRNFSSIDKREVILGSCLPYERHEIPVHLILLIAMMQGWDTVFLGSSPAPGAIEEYVKKTKPKKVVLSATTTIPFVKDISIITKLDQFAKKHKEIDFYLGGEGVELYRSYLQTYSITLTSNLEEVFKG